MERKYPVNDSLFSPTKGIICTVNVTYSEPCKLWAQKKCSSGGKIKNTTLEHSNNSVCKQNKWFDYLGIRDNFRVSWIPGLIKLSERGIPGMIGAGHWLRCVLCLS